MEAESGMRGRRELFAYIEGYYNRARIHSAIGYVTPQQAEAEAA
jgi:transposase InsO family protein